MTEANKIKWVGIRPTNPPESIPVYFKHIGNTYNESVTNTEAGAGVNYLNSTPVPAGEIWIVEHILCFNNTSVSTLIAIGKRISTSTYNIRRKLIPGIGEEVIISSPATLVGSEFIRAQFSGCIAGDDIFLYLTGYKLSP